MTFWETAPLILWGVFFSPFYSFYKVTKHSEVCGHNIINPPLFFLEGSGGREGETMFICACALFIVFFCLLPAGWKNKTLCTDPTSVGDCRYNKNDSGVCISGNYTISTIIFFSSKKMVYREQ